MFYAVDSGYFYAGIEFDENGKVTVYAPILGWVKRDRVSESKFIEYGKKRKWKFIPITTKPKPRSIF